MQLTFEVTEIPTRPPRTRTRRSRANVRNPVATPLDVEHLCPNCEEYFRPTAPSRVYCGLQCRAEASYVRYARRKFALYPSGELPEDIAETIQVMRAHALGGGYDKEARRIPQDVRALVIARDKRCVLCPESGTEIDHIHGESSDPTNLRLLCRACHMKITRSRIVRVTDDETKLRAGMLFVRVDSAEPLHECDADGWAADWRAFIRKNTRPA